MVTALKRRKTSKATGPDEIPVEGPRIGGSGFVVEHNVDVKRRTRGVEGECIGVSIQGEWNVQECGNYRGTELLSHTMKMWARIMDAKLRWKYRSVWIQAWKGNNKTSFHIKADELGTSEEKKKYTG